MLEVSAVLEELCTVLAEGVVILDPDGKVLLFNEAAAGLLAKSGTLTVGAFIDQFIPGLMNLPYKQVANQDYRVAEWISGEEKMKISLLPAAYGAVVIMQEMSSVNCLLHQLKCAQETILDLEGIFKFSYDGIFVSDGKGMGLRLNDSYSRVTGMAPEVAKKLIGMNMAEAVEKQYVSESVSLKVIAKKGPVSTVPKLKSGKKVIMTGSPIFNEKGEIVRVITNVRDISELMTLTTELEKAKQQTELYYSEVLHLRQQQMNLHEMVIESSAMKQLTETALKVAVTNAAVLITGDSGAGKEVMARMIHNHSEQQKGPFIKINCGAIPETLLESELFGYEKGAFTNAAKQGKPGLFEIASGGTVFLDEIGELPLSLQVKLLGVLQDLKFTRIGGVEEKRLNARVITATNRDLAQMVEERQFRKDLYYRINVVALKIAPLTERRDDIFPLARYFLQKFNQKYRVNKNFAPAVIEAFLAYNWPGNVRQLENLVERLVVLAAGEQIDVSMLPEDFHSGVLRDTGVILGKGKTLDGILSDVEREIFAGLVAKGYSTYRIAKELGISQATAVRKLHKLLPRQTKANNAKMN